MKRSQYFNSLADMNNYYPNGVPNDIVAVVGDIIVTTELQVSKGVFTSTNNYSDEAQQMGGDSIVKLVEINNSYSYVQEANAELVQENVELQESYTYLEGQYSDLDSAYTYLDNAYTSLDNAYTDLNTSYVSLEGDYSNLNNAYTSLDNAYTNLETNYETVSYSYTEAYNISDKIMYSSPVYISNYNERITKLMGRESYVNWYYRGFIHQFGTIKKGEYFKEDLTYGSCSFGLPAGSMRNMDDYSLRSYWTKQTNSAVSTVPINFIEEGLKVNNQFDIDNNTIYLKNYDFYHNNNVYTLEFNWVTNINNEQYLSPDTIFTINKGESEDKIDLTIPNYSYYNDDQFNYEIIFKYDDIYGWTYKEKFRFYVK